MLPNLCISARPHQSTKMALEMAASYIKVACPIPVAAMGKCKQINNSNLQYGSDIILLIIHERN